MAATGKKLAYYIGRDMGYAKTLRDRFKKYTYIDDLEFIPYCKFDPAEYQKIFCELIENDARIIYLDFTSNSDEFITLANLIKRDFHFASSALVVLIDDNKLLPKARLTTADFVHLKNGEHYDVAYDPIAIAFPKIVQKLEFAQAKFQQAARLREDVLISYLTPTGCYIETNISLSEGEVIELEHNIPKAILPSSTAIVKGVKTKELVYDYQYGYELAFQVMNEPQFTLEEEESENFEDIKVEKFNEYNELLIRQKKKLKEWVIDQASFSSSNFKIRILIFDEFLSLFKHGEENSKKYPFSVRFQSCLDGSLKDIDRFRPEIIAMQFDPLQVEEEEEGAAATEDDSPAHHDDDDDEVQSSLEKLTEIIRYVKSTEGYRPYIVVCNTTNYDSAVLQNTFKYPFILVNKETVHYAFLKSISELLKKKREDKIDNAIKQKVIQLRKSDPKKYARLRESDLREVKYFVDKRKEIGNAFIWVPIKIFEMTESEVSFVSEREHLIGSRCAIDFPMTLHVTLVPKEAKRPEGIGSTWTVYHGLLGCIHEIQKQELRQFVNKIFFSDLDAKKAAEAEEYKRIQEEGKQRKMVQENEEEEEGGEKGPTEE